MRRAFVVMIVLTAAMGAPLDVATAAVGGCDGQSLPDFNGDGFDDLAAGAPLAGNQPFGAVQILYGSPQGLTEAGATLFTEDTPGMADVPESGDTFGFSLATGDFDNDGRDDLAVGVPGKEVNGTGAAGSVHIIYGSAAGLTASGDQVFHQDTSGIADQAGLIEQFGTALASCDFDNDGRDDLAVGIPGQEVNSEGSAGAVHVIYGSATGLTASGDQVFHQDTSGMADAAESSDEFGTSLRSGDFDGDGRGDLAVGIPLENVEPVFNSGAVHVLYGSSAGLNASGDQVFSQDTSGMAESSEDLDRFGNSLASGDFDSDGRDDLAVGVPGEFVSGPGQIGAVHTIYGTSTGLSVSGDQVFHRATSGVAGDAQADSGFGFAVGAGDFDGDGSDDLVAGVPFDTVSGDENAGSMHTFYGSGSGLSASGDQIFHQDVSGVADAAHEFDFFAAAVSTADFNGDGRDDVVAGIEGESFDDVGAVHIFRSSATGVSASGDVFLLGTQEGQPGDLFGASLVGSPALRLTL